MSAAALRVASVSCWIALLAGTSAGREFWLDVPFIRQARQGCGSACIAMVMAYWDRSTQGRGIDRDAEPVIYRKLYSPKEQGIRAEAMQQYLQGQGFRVFVFRGSWLDLEEQISKGRPVIVCLEEGRTHYTVVAGIDPEAGVVLLNDPARRKLLKMKRAEFEKGWRGSGNWTLLAVPRGPVGSDRP